MTNLEPAIKFFGSLNKVAYAVGVEPMTAHQWKKRGLPVERAVDISKATGGAVKPSDLRPDFKWT
jgi:DNA-binding transcriptional regulator YdaS (Cro superfamily)